MRPLWSGSISFGLVNIPVKLYPATQEHTLDFMMLHKKDNSPIRFARFCKLEEKEVPYQEIVRGIETKDGQYVVFTNEDFAKVHHAKASTIEIEEFVDEKEIDPIYFDKSFYLEPQKNAGKSYMLLMAALQKSGKVGIAKFVLRNREHLVVVKAQKNIIILNQLRFAHEIRDSDALNIPEKEKTTSKEVDLAITLIDQLTQSFDINKYKDTYDNDLRKLIAQKARGKKVILHEPETTTAPTKIVDLFATLKASLKKPKKHTSHKPRKAA